MSSSWNLKLISTYQQQFMLLIKMIHQLKCYPVLSDYFEQNTDLFH